MASTSRSRSESASPGAPLVAPGAARGRPSGRAGPRRVRRRGSRGRARPARRPSAGTRPRPRRARAGSARWSENDVSTTTATAGCPSAIRRVASIPSRTGISRSISTTSGCCSAHEPDGLLAVLGGADELDVVERRREVLEPGADDGMVIRDEESDHRCGSSSVKRRPGARRRAYLDVGSRPRRELLEQREPDMPVRTPPLPLLGREADAVVEDDEPGDAVPAPESDGDGRRHGVALDVAQRLGGGAVDEALLVRRRAGDRRRPRARSRRRVRRAAPAGRPAPPRARSRAGWAGGSRRAASGGCASRRGSPPPRRAASRASRGRRRRLGRGAERVRDAGEVLDGAVVEVGRDPAPLVGRRLDGADEQRLALLWLLCRRRPSRHASGTWTSQRRTRLASKRTAKGSQIRRPVASTASRRWYVSKRSSVPSGVRTARRPRRGRPAPARSGSPGRRGRPARLSPCRPQRLQLGGLQREPRPDQARLVRVHDAAAAVPQLDPDDTVAEHALVDDPVDGVDRRGVPVEERRVERGLDDALPGEHRELPGVAKRLVLPEARGARGRPSRRRPRAR